MPRKRKCAGCSYTNQQSYQEAYSQVCKGLQGAKEMQQTFIANIAMAIHDEYVKDFPALANREDRERGARRVMDALFETRLR
jgi:hypothetical protein